jgi:hypothetical protein
MGSGVGRPEVNVLQDTASARTLAALFGSRVGETGDGAGGEVFTSVTGVTCVAYGWRAVRDRPLRRPAAREACPATCEAGR